MRKICISVAQVILGVLVLLALFTSADQRVYGQQLPNRSVRVSTATPSATASHTFQMNLASIGNVGSIVFEYCSNSPLMYDTCSAPAGLSLSSAVLSQQSGNSGFVIDNIDSTASKLVISRPIALSAAVPSTYTFDNIVNPSIDNTTTYVRISTYLSTQGAGSYIDNGSVAFSTSTNFTVGAFVPPFLNLCVGVTVSVDCSLSNGFGIDLGILSPQVTRTLTSQFSASTNDVSGYSTYVLGTTMTSGNNIIPANNSQQPSLSGVSQFGINLRANSKPPGGNDPVGFGTSFPTINYNSPNMYIFNNGDEIANSTLSTYYNRMTVSYVVNVSASQPPGIYSTTLTYLVVAQF